MGRRTVSARVVRDMATSVAPMHFGCDSHLSKSSRGSVRSADETAAIAAVGAGKRSRHVAVATYDKKCALDTLARILGLCADPPKTAESP